MPDPTIFKRRIMTLLAAGLLAVSGAAAAGCGGDDGNISDNIDQAVEDVQGEAEGVKEDLEGAADDAQNEIDQAADDAQNEIDGAVGNGGG